MKSPIESTVGEMPASIADYEKPKLPTRAADLTVRELIPLYWAYYAGRDHARLTRLGWWGWSPVGALTLGEIEGDHIHAAMQDLEHEPARRFAGKDADGAPIFKPTQQRKKSGATLNRYLVALQAVFTWAEKKRITPKAWANPCKGVEKHAEGAGKQRFLDKNERQRILDAAKKLDAEAAQRPTGWAKLRLLVLMALTTGHRKGALVGLRWKDIDFAAKTAVVGRTKNGDPAVMPLEPAVVEELQRWKGAQTALVFASNRRPSQPYDFGFAWRALLKEAKIRNFRFHDLRHTVASTLMQKNVPVLQIADLLGHKQLSMTMRYAHQSVENRAAVAARVLDDVQV